MTWNIEAKMDSYRSDSEDRFVVVSYPYGSLLAVTDGMGGRRGGADAAEYGIQALRHSFPSLSSPPRAIETMNFLIYLDREMCQLSSTGETTIVCGFLTPNLF